MIMAKPWTFFFFLMDFFAVATLFGDLFKDI